VPDDLELDENLEFVSDLVRGAAKAPSPRPDRIKANSWIAEDTRWLVVQRRTAVNGQLWDHFRWRIDALRACCLVWQGHVERGTRSILHLCHPRPGCMVRAAWRRSAATSKMMIMRDREAHLLPLFSTANRAEMSGDSKSLFSTFKRLRLFKPRPLPSLADADGTVGGVAAEALCKAHAWHTCG
jgi:hypothetical protein